jgi:Zn-dependent peptidase ImmA (M78 family)
LRVSPARIKSEVKRVLELPVAQSRPLDVDALAEALGFKVVYQVLRDDQDISGFYLREGSETVIGINKAHARVRRRFTLAHEIGHALLERGGTMHIDRAFRLRDARSSLAIDDDEIAANAFAAELLMPEEEVRGAVAEGLDITDDRALRDLAEQFGVSQQAFMYRLVNLGITLNGQALFD